MSDLSDLQPINVLIRKASRQACGAGEDCKMYNPATKNFCVECGLPARNPSVTPYDEFYDCYNPSTDKLIPVGDWSSPSVEPDIPYKSAHKWLLVAVGLVLVLNVFDIYVTLLALDLGATEMNPLAKWLIETEVVVPIIWPVKIGVCLWAGLMAWYPDKTSLLRRFIVSWWIVGIYSMVVFMNAVTYMMRR